jgi:hypothetical protein
MKQTMIDKPSISRLTALEALAELSNADAVISGNNHTSCEQRTATIKKLEQELGVVVRTTKAGQNHEY